MEQGKRNIRSNEALGGDSQGKERKGGRDAFAWTGGYWFGSKRIRANWQEGPGRLRLLCCLTNRLHFSPFKPLHGPGRIGPA